MTNISDSPACVKAANLSEQMSAAASKAVDDVLIGHDLQKHYLLLQQARCECQMETQPVNLTGMYCPRTWDNVMCWGDTAAATTALQPCPIYINMFNTQGQASRLCLPNGTWFINPLMNGTNGWTNFTDCYSDITPAPPTLEVPALLQKHLLEFRIMYNVGYGLSLVFLIFAMAIMIYFKRLHCSRNTIHMNLFVSFMFRAAISLIRDNFVKAGMGFPSDLTFNDSGGVVGFKDGPHWECRMFFSVFQYAIAASYMWIFVEAVYIHMLIFVSVFTEKVKVGWFMLLGWSVPLVFVLIWSLARLTLDNTLCWNTTKNKPGLTWILQGPIMLTMVINFFFFISLVWVLYTKLSASPEVKKSKYRTLARSALFLIPVFGVYYIIFTLPLHKFNDNVASVMLFIEMFFNSYQGVFIAVVLCFINTEVRTEIRKAWYQNGLRRGSITSTAMRTGKSKAKRETLVIGETTDYEMPVVVVENGNAVSPAVQDLSDEEQPFLELPAGAGEQDISSRESRDVGSRDFGSRDCKTQNGAADQDRDLRDEFTPRTQYRDPKQKQVKVNFAAEDTDIPTISATLMANDNHSNDSLSQDTTSSAYIHVEGNLNPEKCDRDNNNDKDLNRVVRCVNETPDCLQTNRR